MERITEAQLNSALTAPVASLQRSLSSVDSSRLLALMESLTRRYPSQGQEESIAEYFRDYERLALRYSLLRVEEAVAALRIDPEQKFFPRPDEVASQIKRDRAGDMFRAMQQEAQEYLDRLARWQHVYFSKEERDWREQMGFTKKAV